MVDLTVLANVEEGIASKGSPILRGFRAGQQAADQERADVIKSALANALSEEKIRSEQSKQKQELAHALQLQTLAATYFPDLQSKMSLRGAQSAQALAAAALSQGRLAHLGDAATKLGPAGEKLYEDHTKALDAAKRSQENLAKLPQLFSKLSRTDQKTLSAALHEGKIEKLLSANNPAVAELSSTLINSVLPTLKETFGGRITNFETQTLINGFLNPASTPEFNAKRLNELINHINKQTDYQKTWLNSVEQGADIVQAGKAARQSLENYKPIPVHETVAESYHNINDIGDYYRSQLVKSGVKPDTARKIIDVYNKKYANSANYRSNIKNLLNSENVNLINQGKLPQGVFEQPQQDIKEQEPQPQEQGSSIPASAISLLSKNILPKFNVPLASFIP